MSVRSRNLLERCAPYVAMKTQRFRGARFSLESLSVRGYSRLSGSLKPDQHRTSSSFVGQGRNSDPNQLSAICFIQRGLLACGMIYCFSEYGYALTLCEGPSMSPTIRSCGEIVLLDKWSIRRYGIQDGTVGEERAKAAAARQKAQKDKTFWHQPYISVQDLRPASWTNIFSQTFSPLSVGDVVVIHHPDRKGTVCKRVLGLPGDSILPHSGRLVVVPDGHLWLEGDNPGNSSDSRQYGPVPLSLLVGRASFRVWPLRGQATLRRGASPRPSPGAARAVYNSTILPAGYDGEHIVKSAKGANEASS